MLRISRSSFFVFIALLFSFSTAHAVRTGAPAPDFSLKGTDGKTYSLAEAQGEPKKIVVLEWFNPKCPFTQKHYNNKYANMQNMQKKYQEKGVVWFTVMTTGKGKDGALTPEEITKQMTEWDAHPTAVLLDTDGSVAKKYGAKSTPHMFVINSEGKIAYQGAIDSKKSAEVGEIPTATNYVIGALDFMLDPKNAGKSVKIGTTAPYGCPIKF